MALADIIEKIKADGVKEAEQIVSAANEQASEIVAHAQEVVASERARALAHSEEVARREANIILVNGRLKARDTELEHKRAVIDEVLSEVVAEIEGLDAASFAELIVSKALATSYGTEQLLIAGLSSGQVTAITDALHKRQSGITVQVDAKADEKSQPTILLQGDGVSVDLSPAALVEQSRRELEPMLAGVLFGSADEVKK